MPYFNSSEGDLLDIFIDDPSILEQFVGNQLWIWGKNGYGQLGDNTITHRSSPIQTVSGGTNWKQLAGGYYHIAGIKTDGTLWLWGHNTHGQLGDNTIIHRSSPIQTVSGGTNWKQVACGHIHTAAIKTNGSLWSWGNNGNGELGDGTIVNKSSPVQTVSGGTNWKQVSCGSGFTGAIKTDGTLWLWGSNFQGQLGDNTSGVGYGKSSPVQCALQPGWITFSCGYNHTAAIDNNLNLYTWGDNSAGELGLNDMINRSSPVQVISAPGGWRQVSCGFWNTFAISSSLSDPLQTNLYTWGANGTGQLGDGGTTNKSYPTAIPIGGNNWKQVASKSLAIGAIKTDGTLWVWGNNNDGALGLNTYGSNYYPTQTYAYGTNWKQVICMSGSMAAITYTES